VGVGAPRGGCRKTRRRVNVVDPVVVAGDKSESNDWVWGKVPGRSLRWCTADRRAPSMEWYDIVRDGRCVTRLGKKSADGVTGAVLSYVRRVAPK